MNREEIENLVCLHNTMVLEGLVMLATQGTVLFLDKTKSADSVGLVYENINHTNSMHLCSVRYFIEPYEREWNIEQIEVPIGQILRNMGKIKIKEECALPLLQFKDSDEILIDKDVAQNMIDEGSYVISGILNRTGENDG